mmetsp:Transcript_12307/g.22329  ORF Transcript_12307/g.22329 Transcript_12307/m.22329 type:complete len:385 (-) Transcript_12307:124-1278(-)|eukprot:CAMPEP_0198295744 /NCGR_PEP_ID=MMETSP1449-20131203/29311_1 /TAXON_ID=420275 /ORGANISM="Attheya septentrionalis, Strain CCMP2084" /LENGTH=384 /DNA_ID=CAMNT_0043996143 /DNA_START=34 /DNA_END=1188 /DNA_ORIENTATION=-
MAAEGGSSGESLAALLESKHASYISGLAAKLDAPGSYEGAVTEHLRMSGVYWSIAALSLLRSPEEVNEIMGLDAIIDWLFSCQLKGGGFGGNTGHDAHLLYTLSALQILAMADRLDDPRLETEDCIRFIAALQNETDGSFAGDEWGEIDTRFSYCALSALSILNRFDAIDVDKAAEYVASCRNEFDGGFGCVPGAESHAGQIFCCIGALSIAQRLDLLLDDKDDLLSWWLAERQCDSGGLNGRPEKQADVCYSWWILSALSILGRVHWISGDKLASFILQCQDDDDGGIADRPGDMPDVFHTFFGIAGLSLLGHLHTTPTDATTGNCNMGVFREIDPVYALPTDVVERLALKGQVMTRKDNNGMEETVHERLTRYNVLVSNAPK